MRFVDVDAPAPTVAHVGELLSPLDRPAATVSAGGTSTGGAEPFANAAYRRRLGEALDALDAPAPTVRANAGHEAPDAERASRRPIAKVAAAVALLDRPACTITTVADEGGDPKRPKRRPQVALRSALGEGARLSLNARALLQGFPPGFVWHGRTQGSKDKQCGNAVPPQLGEAVGRSIAAALQAARVRAA